MTDRYSTLTVVLGKDIREDDAEVLLSTIRMLKGVIGVSGNITAPDAYMAEERAKYYYRDKLRGVLWE